jgi:hypothetical protein
MSVRVQGEEQKWKIVSLRSKPPPKPCDPPKHFVARRKNLSLYEFKLKAVLRAVRYANWLLWQVDGLSLFKIPVLEGVVLRDLLDLFSELGKENSLAKNVKTDRNPNLSEIIRF